ncbi:LOB domain-containing protein 27 [Sesamum alatum]|uniref:LOB domain-containing protein 27 n=1 Tax=Sesamum alatum TaxID=300844 RepID=A0AAE1YAN0_9LAMI|nr:LOB domain-containing protein 27 [Sesamum alatum]
MTVKGGTTPACAACKYQRRKCSPTCPLAPYFPANQSKMFQNVHRLFGVSNITKTLISLNTKDQKEDAMKSIIYEAEMRERFPVYGCSVIICQLRLQMQYALEELRYVYAHLDACREQLNNNNNNNNKQVDHPSECWPSGQLEFGSCLSSDVPIAFQRQSVGSDTPNGVNQFFLNDSSGFYAESSPDSLARPLLDFEPGSDTMSNNNLTAVQAQMESISIQQERNEFFQDFEGMPFNTTIDDRQSYIETNKEAFESCSESSLKDTTQSVERDLKTAAAGFSLTTVN